MSQDAVPTYDDVDLRVGRLADRLRAEQYRHFMGETWLEAPVQTPAPVPSLDPGA